MRERLGCPTLQQRRCVARLHKIENNNIAINVPDYISKSTWSLRGQQQQAYIIPQNTVEAYQFSFFPCTIRCWNQLLISLTEVPSQETFQNCMWKAVDSEEIEVCHPRELHLIPRLGSCSQPQLVLVFWWETQERWAALYIVCIIVFKQTNACNLVFSCTPGQYTWKGHVPVIYVDVDETAYHRVPAHCLHGYKCDNVNIVVVGTVIATIAWGVSSTAVEKESEREWEREMQAKWWMTAWWACNPRRLLWHAQCLFPHLPNSASAKLFFDLEPTPSIALWTILSVTDSYLLFIHHREQHKVST